MAPCEHVLVVLLLLLARAHLALPDRRAAPGREERHDGVAQHMRSLYGKYRAEGFRLRDGNTVRSFRAARGTIDGKQMQIFNLTSLAESEHILTSTLHYYMGDFQNTTHFACARSRRCGHHWPRSGSHQHVNLNIWSFGSVDNKTTLLAHFRINVSHRDIITWQWKDVTHVLNQAKAQGRLLLAVDFEAQGVGPQKELLLELSPYILVYANDSAISELDSVVSALQGSKAMAFQSQAMPGLERLHALVHDSMAAHRMKRSANIHLLPLQNNELPGPEYPHGTEAWQETGPYEPLEDPVPKRPRKKLRKGERHKTPLLRFDERTMKKARRKQWSEPRSCARRYLKVDFADIGWSEWIISPKSFDAYYCSGSCEFPMPKSLKPSNHATIQSIVRAVGVVPGIPEPCCVPEKMSSLSILFFDEDKNVVLKVYPNMTVDSCACR
ncbi:bone morphogenetic protein 3 [Arapaima gigas]